MKLLVDSGSTKADWIAIDDNGKVVFTTQSLGLNPEVLNNDEIIHRLDDKFDIKQNIKLYASIDESNGYKQVKMASSYPGLNVLDIENINLINNKLNEVPKKRDRWVMGVGVGYGVSLVNGSTLSLSPWIGASLLWTPKWLQFGK